MSESLLKRHRNIRAAGAARGGATEARSFILLLATKRQPQRQIATAIQDMRHREDGREMRKMLPVVSERVKTNNRVRRFGHKMCPLIKHDADEEDETNSSSVTVHFI